MSTRTQNTLLYAGVSIIALYFLFLGLAKASGFFIPLVLGMLLALLLIPVASRLERWGVGRGWAAFFSAMLVILFLAGLVWLLSIQVNRFVEDWPKIKEQLTPKITKVEQYIADQFGLSPREQEVKLKEQLPLVKPETGKGSNSSDGGAQSIVQQVVGGVGATLLTFVYIFFFLLYRNKFKKSILKFFRSEKTDEVMHIINNAGKVAQQYLAGRFILILILAVLYSIGLSVAGVKHAILVSVLAAVLSLIPYIGNVIGVVLAIAMALFTEGSTNTIIGIIIVFSVTQFIESYMLEPFIVGRKLNLNPVITINGCGGRGRLGRDRYDHRHSHVGYFKIIFDHISFFSNL